MTLIVVPARGGSVGIPRKAIRPLGGIPPLVRTLRTLKDVPGVVVVVTDANEIADLAIAEGAHVVREPTADGSRPLDACVFEAVSQLGGQYDIVATVQVTSPFTTSETVKYAIAAARDYGSAITVRDDRALRWIGPAGTRIKSFAPQRIIRQQMDPTWRETGAVFATQRQYVSPTSRFAPQVHLIEVSGKEAIDLDTQEDWVLAEWYAGATLRELLLARVLAPQPHRGTCVILSAWDEAPTEAQTRCDMLTQFSATYRPLARNTYDEAQMTIRDLMGHDELTNGDMTILTSAYHQPRAFLTFLQVLHEWGLDRTIRLWNAAVPSSMDNLTLEWSKITTYQERGHVASYEAGLQHLAWRDTPVAVAA